MNNVVILLVSLAVVVVTLGVMWRLGTWPFAVREPFGGGGGNANSTVIGLLNKAEKLLSDTNPSLGGIGSFLDGEKMSQAAVNEHISLAVQNIIESVSVQWGVENTEINTALVIGLINKASHVARNLDPNTKKSKKHQVDVNYAIAQAVDKAVTSVRKKEDAAIMAAAKEAAVNAAAAKAKEAAVNAAVAKGSWAAYLKAANIAESAPGYSARAEANYKAAMNAAVSDPLIA